VSKQLVTFDDTWYHIDIDNMKTLILGCFEYTEVRDILLTDKQLIDYMSECTNREFNISNSRIDKGIKFINSAENPWRDNKELPSE
jgi:hypothetical protein